eukprot:UN10232
MSTLLRSFARLDRRFFSHKTNPLRCTESLVQEHKTINQTLDALEIIIEREQDFNEYMMNDIGDFVHWSINFSDKIHHEKEEKILFKAMNELKIPFLSTTHGPIKEMIYQHDVLIYHMDEIRKGLKIENNSYELKYQLSEYVQLLRSHNKHEDNILWPMIIQQVSDDEMEKISKEFDRVDSENESEIATLFQLTKRLINKYTPTVDAYDFR